MAWEYSQNIVLSPLFFQEKTIVGCPNAETTPDIQLSGLGIQPEHCIVEIEDSDVFVSPFEGARYVYRLRFFLFFYSKSSKDSMGVWSMWRPSGTFFQSLILPP